MQQMASAGSLVPGSVALTLLLCLVACGSEDGGTPSGTENTGDPPAMGLEEVGTRLPGAQPCTQPHTICMNLQVPAPMQGSPSSLQFDIYDSASPPSHLPNGFAGIFRSLEMTPGEQLYFELSDSALQGDYWMWVILYMEGGGYGAPVNGVDYVMHSAPAALHLDGSPLNISEPVVLGL